MADAKRSTVLTLRNCELKVTSRFSQHHLGKALGYMRKQSHSLRYWEKKLVLAYLYFMFPQQPGLRTAWAGVRGEVWKWPRFSRVDERKSSVHFSDV